MSDGVSSGASSPARIGLVSPLANASSGALDEHRLAGVGAALVDAGAEPELILYDEGQADAFLDRLSGMDGALVWVNPQEQGRDRTLLDQALREAASGGVVVSAHPDVIDSIGTKEVVFHTRHLGWGTDTRLYRTWDEMRAEIPNTLDQGPRVLKRERGNGGSGVWRVERTEAGDVLVRHAARGSRQYRVPLDEFVRDCLPYFEGGATMLDQAYQPRLTEGMIRCYLVGDQVAGFGEQAVNALYPAAPGEPPDSALEPGERLYYPPDRPDLQHLKRRLEGAWVPGLCAARSLDPSELPVIWDADFLHGPDEDNGDPGYVLCEINVSSVYPFPDSALGPLAAEMVRRVSR